MVQLGRYQEGPDADPQNAYECIHSHDTGIKDTLKDITNYEGILDITLECGRLEIHVGYVHAASYILKADTFIQ